MVCDIVTFCDALREKYSLERLDNDFENIEIAPNRRALHLKQQNHSKRTTLSLDGCKVNRAGDAGEIQETCPLIEELDLSSNRFDQYDQILLITNQLKELSFLNLSHNSLGHIDLSLLKDEYLVQCQPHLNKLVLNNTKVDFKTVFELLKIFPSVNELHLSLNGLNEVPDSDCSFPCVTSLHYTNNGVNDWNNILKLGKLFPNLETLIICENKIERVICNQYNLINSLGNLKKLSITKNLITDWKCVEKFNSLPSLKDIRLKNIPLLSNYTNEKEKRFFLMVRLPNAKLINGSLVDENERDDAERMFLRAFKDDENKPDMYYELIKKHGELTDLVHVEMCKRNFATVTFIGDIDKSTVVKLDLSKSCRKLRKEISEEYDIPLPKLRLFRHDIDRPPFGPTLMYQLNHTLNLYHFKDGDEIEIQRLDIID